MFGYSDHHPMVRCGIVVDDGFPPTFQHVEMIMEFTKHYSPTDRTIKYSNQNILADFSLTSMFEAFGTPTHLRMVMKTQE